MGTLRALSIFVIVFSAIELTLLLIVGMNFFPPSGDKECNHDVITKIINSVNAREEFTCVHLRDIPMLFYRTFLPFKRLSNNLLWQLPFHCVTVLIIIIILFIVTKCENDCSRHVLRKYHHLAVRYDRHNSALIAKHGALRLPTKYYRTL